MILSLWTEKIKKICSVGPSCNQRTSPFDQKRLSRAFVVRNNGANKTCCKMFDIVSRAHSHHFCTCELWDIVRPLTATAIYGAAFNRCLNCQLQYISLILCLCIRIRYFIEIRSLLNSQNQRNDRLNRKNGCSVNRRHQCQGGSEREGLLILTFKFHPKLLLI